MSSLQDQAVIRLWQVLAAGHQVQAGAARIARVYVRRKQV
jgi:hypothetical protein